MAVPETLAALQVNPETGLGHSDVAVRRKEHGYNEVTEKKGRGGPRSPVDRLVAFWPGDE
jgi:hypothetical protein